MHDDVRIEVLTDAIKSLPKGEMKDALADDLRFVQEINGTTDPALKGIKRIVISGVRRELLMHDRISEAINEHTIKCPLAKLPEGRRGMAFTWVEMIRPFRWPLSLACFSPFASDILCKVISIFK